MKFPQRCSQEGNQVAIPRTFVPGVLALAHSMRGHPSVAQKTLGQAKYSQPTLSKDVRKYVPPCVCRRRKRESSQRVAILPARCLWSRKAPKMDTQDMKEAPHGVHRYLLVVLDRSNTFLYPLPTKDSLGVAWTLLDLMLDHGSVDHPRSPRAV